MQAEQQQWGGRLSGSRLTVLRDTQKKSELMSCVKVQVAVLGSPVPNKPAISVDVKRQHFNNRHYY